MDKRKVVIGLHSNAPAPIWTSMHEAPSPTLFGCVCKWTQLIQLTSNQYDKLPAFGIAIEVMNNWSEDTRSERAAMKALWHSPRLNQLNESISLLEQARMEELRGQMQKFSIGRPPDITWNESAWSQMPVDLEN